MAEKKKIGRIEFLMSVDKINQIRGQSCPGCWWQGDNCGGIVSMVLGVGAILYTQDEEKREIDDLENLVAENRPECFTHAEGGNMKVRDRHQSSMEWYWPSQFK